MKRERSQALGKAGDWKTRLPRRVHWLLFLILACSLYFFVFRRYGFASVETPTLRAIYPERESARLLVDRQAPHALARESLVWWEHDGTTLFSRVVGIPGDRFERSLNARWVRISETGEHLVYAPEIELPARLDGAILAPAQYILLADHVASAWPDSRTVGIVPRSAIRYRVILSL